jgi:hypothetical protein
MRRGMRVGIGEEANKKREILRNAKKEWIQRSRRNKEIG